MMAAPAPATTQPRTNFAIWVSIGERSFSTETTLARLCQIGCDGLRINLARETGEWTVWAVSTLAKVGWPVERIFLDIGNRKPRIRRVPEAHTSVSAADAVVLSPTAVTPPTDSTILVDDLQPLDFRIGDRVVAGDGDTIFRVNSTTDREVRVRALADGILEPGLSLVREGVTASMFRMAEAETRLVRDLLSTYPVGLLVSFVDTPETLLAVRREFPTASTFVPKLETASSLRNIASILADSRTAVLARGDLATSIGLERLPAAQAFALNAATQLNAKLILATEFLWSLKYRHRPTRSEAIDIWNAVVSGGGGILLTSETAAAPDPFSTIEHLLALVAAARAQRCLPPDDDFDVGVPSRVGRTG